MRKTRIALGAAALIALGFLAGRYSDQRMEASGTDTTAAPATTDAAVPTSAAAPDDDAVGYTLPNTRVHSLPDSVSGRRYEVWVDLPPSYFENDRPYPVVFTTDSDYGFPLIRSLRRRVGANGRNIEDFILVGLSYAEGQTSMVSKRRDYTPTDPFAREGVTPDPDAYDRGSAYGHAAEYRDYIERQVFPLIARRYRIDADRKIYIGHSLGGLFGSYVLLTKPTMFRKYIIASPSFWFDRRTIYDLEARMAGQRKDLSAEVMLYIGSYETKGPTPRHLRKTDMIGDMRRFEIQLRGRGYPNLRIDSEIIADEDHLTVFPDMATRGLRWALPGSGPYTGS